MRRKLAAPPALPVALALAHADAADFKSRSIKFSYGTAEDHLAPQEMAKFQAAVRPVVDKHAKEVDEKLVKQAYAAIQAGRK